MFSRVSSATQSILPSSLPLSLMMHRISTVDGFVGINECLAEMIKYVANEPSVGLFYIQQHVQSTVPNLINLKNGIVEKSREVTLQSEDLEDFITVTKSMKDCGFPVADEMIRDINNSLAIMSKKFPKGGWLIRIPSSPFQMAPAIWGRPAVFTQQDGGNSDGYLSAVLRSAKQRASNFKWPRLDFKELKQAKGEKLLSYSNPFAAEKEAEELAPNHVVDGPREHDVPPGQDLIKSQNLGRSL